MEIYVILLAQKNGLSLFYCILLDESLQAMQHQQQQQSSLADMECKREQK
jgi:hypothetical protein